MKNEGADTLLFGGRIENNWTFGGSSVQDNRGHKQC